MEEDLNMESVLSCRSGGERRLPWICGNILLPRVTLPEDEKLTIYKLCRSVAGSPVCEPTMQEKSFSMIPTSSQPSPESRTSASTKSKVRLTKS